MKVIVILALIGTFSLIGCSHFHRDHGRHQWEQMDTNHDGTVTKEEFEKAHSEMFKSMDANNDGKITMEEKKAFHKSNCDKKDCNECSKKKECSKCAKKKDCKDNGRCEKNVE